MNDQSGRRLRLLTVVAWVNHQTKPSPLPTHVNLILAPPRLPQDAERNGTLSNF
jgi:hypothetical protein